MKSPAPWRKIQWILHGISHSSHRPIRLPKLSALMEEVLEPQAPQDPEAFQIQLGLEVLNSSVVQALVDNNVRVAIAADSDLLTQPDVWDDLMVWSEEKTS